MRHETYLLGCLIPTCNLSVQLKTCVPSSLDSCVPTIVSTRQAVIAVPARPGSRCRPMGGPVPKTVGVTDSKSITQGLKGP